MRSTLPLFLFAVLLRLEGTFACFRRAKTAPTRCPTWVRNGMGPIDTILNSEVAAKAFLFQTKNGTVASKGEFEATFANVSAMSSVMEEWGSQEGRGSTVATILKFLDTRPELQASLRNTFSAHSSCLEDSRTEMLTAAERILRVFNENATIRDRVEDAKLGLDSLDQMLSAFGETANSLARTKGSSAPYLISLATIYAAIGRLIVRYERTYCYPDNCTATGDFSRMEGEMKSTRVTQEDYVQRIGQNFAYLRERLIQYRKEGLEERLNLIKEENREDCNLIYESRKLEGGKCKYTRMVPPNDDNEVFMIGCVTPNANDNANVPGDIAPSPGFFDAGTGKHICLLLENCLDKYKYQITSSYEEHYQDVILRLYLGDKAQKQSASWNELLQTDIFSPLEDIIQTPTCDMRGVLEELKALLENSESGPRIYHNYRESYHNPFFPVDQEMRTAFEKALMENAERNLDYQAGLSPWRAGVNQFTDAIISL